jgi:hypothetical protein
MPRKAKGGRKPRIEVRIQLHAFIPVPPGCVLHPNLVTELLDNWIDGEDLPFGEVREIDWEIREGARVRVGRERKKPGEELDSNQTLRQSLIGRFRGGSYIVSEKQSDATKSTQENQDQELGESVSDWGDLEEE